MQKSLSEWLLASWKRSLTSKYLAHKYLAHKLTFGALTLATAIFFTFCLLFFAPSVSALGYFSSDKSSAKTSDDAQGGAKSSANVKIIVIEEYMSLTCPHCATFHREIYPELARSVFKSEYVSFQYRDYPLDRVALTGAILSRCGGDALRGKIVGAMLERQDRLLSAAEPLGILLRILQLVGIDEQRAQACLGDKSLERAVLEEQLEGKRLHKISSTPTIIVAGAKITGRLSAKKIIAAVDAALRRAGLPAR